MAREAPPRLRALWLPRPKSRWREAGCCAVGGGGGGGGSRRRRGRACRPGRVRSQGDRAGSLGHGAAAVTARTGPPAPRPQPRPERGGRAPSAYEAAASSKQTERRRRGWWRGRGRGPGPWQQQQVQERRPRARPDAGESGGRCQGPPRRPIPALPRLLPPGEPAAAAKKTATTAVIYGLENFLANTMLLRARQGGCTAAPDRRVLSPCSRSPAGNTDTAAPDLPRSLTPWSARSASGQPWLLTPKLLRRLSAPPQDPSEGSARAAPVLHLLPCPALLPEPRDAVWLQPQAISV